MDTNFTNILVVRSLNLSSSPAATPSPSEASEHFDDPYNYSSHEYACFGLERSDPMMFISYNVFTYTATCLVFLGLFGNSLSFIVFSSGELKELPTTVHLLMLSLSDSAYLLCVFFTKIITKLRCLHFPESRVDFFNRETISCKLLQLLLDLFSDTSSCLILIFTVERFISIRFPVIYREKFTIIRARIAGVATLLFITLCIAPYHMLYIGRPMGFDVCSVLPAHEDILLALYMTEATLFRIVPVFVIAILNIGIATNVKRFTARQLRRQMSVRTRHRESKNNELNIILLLVSVSYIVMYLPELVHFVLWRLDSDKIIEIDPTYMSLLHTFSSLLYISAFAINFVLYTIGCKVFREHLSSIISTKWKLFCKTAGKRGSSARDMHPVEMQLI